MFEGLVHQLLLGYLGRYFKDIQKEQLKIRLEEVLLENVELILEAFDYLQLPFALKQGRVGKLSIKIPWKKPWDPIIIILEDVFVSVSQRGDQEWSADAVEKREFAGKKAKLAAAELEKLSRRVCGSYAGQSFTSHITEKILDSIQVDIRNFHVLYSDVQNDIGHIMFGLKFSNLTMKKNTAGPSNGRGKMGQDHKIIEIKGLEFYSCMFHGSLDLVTVNGMSNIHITSDIRSEGKHNSILAPCDVTLILSANRSQMPDDNTPQYSITAELSGLGISLDEAQLQQMFLVWDYVCICRLREKYGCFRPWHCPLPRKFEGWQIIWWHYAQKSVLSDVRRKLKKTSWRYLWDRLSYRRKYINLYKIKLDFLQQEQPVDEDVIRDLEEMEKESDLDDILNYRSAAEYDMREFLSSCSTPNNRRIQTENHTEKLSNDEHAVKSRGWLNWLSRGMLGAGGSDDSSQFSGVVSYDVKDMSEATEFHPMVSSSVDVATKHELCIFVLKFEIHQISATLYSKRYDKGIAEVILEGGIVESKLYKEHGIIVSKFKSGKVVDLKNQEVILHIRGPILENNTLDNMDNSCFIQVIFSSKRDVDMSVKGVIQQIEVMFDANILLNMMEFYDVFTSFKFHNERVLLSLNGMEDDNIRLISKAEYVFANNKKVMWDIAIFDVSVNIPWGNTTSEYCNLVMNSSSLCFNSTDSLESLSSKFEEQPHSVKNFFNSISTSEICLAIQLQDLYNYFDVRLNDFKITMMNSDQSQKVPVLQKLSASFFLASCVIPDESILKQLEVYVLIESLKAHFSPSIFVAFIELITYACALHLSHESEILNSPYPPNMVSVMPKSSAFGISVRSKLGSVDLGVDLENSGDNSSELMVSLQELDLRYGSTEVQELFLSIRSLMVCVHKSKDEKDSRLVLLSGNLSSAGEESFSRPSIEDDQYSDAPMSGDVCFAVHYESPGADLVCHTCIMYLNNADIHCYPHIVGLLIGFFNKLSSYNTRFENSAAGDTSEISKILPTFGSQKFGFSNYFEYGSSDSYCIPLEHFPFVTIYNSGSLCNLESALIYAIPEWRKYFALRDGKIKSSKINMRRGSKFFHVSPSKPRSDFEYLLESGNVSISNIFSIELHLRGIRVHFHDSSCIIGTIVLPTSKSSLLFSEDSIDILSSSEGLVLTSSWWARNFQDYLWGPSSNLSPILNVRVRKEQNVSSTTKLEVSISIQHVYCMLPSEYLAIIIGYFSLSEWGGDSSGQFPILEQSDINCKNEMSITYKFEVLDSTLILPVESHEHQFLKLELQQLYCSFIEDSGFDNVLKNIPPECSVPIHTLAKRNNCLNVFARELCLSFILCKNDMHGLGTIERNTEFVTSTLFAPINADVWVRIPCEDESNCNSSSSSSICFMTSISKCHVVAEDSHFFDGCMAICDVIDEFSTVDDISKCFQSDVLQFLHLKRSLQGSSEIPASMMASTKILTEFKCCTQSLLISICHRKEDSVELITKGDFQFICSASLINNSLVWLDLGFSTLVLYSPHDSVLAKCTSTSSSTLVLGLSFSKSGDGHSEVGLFLSSLDIWLCLSEWNEVAKFVNHFSAHLEKTVPVDAAPKSLSFNAAESVKRTEERHVSGSLDSKSNSAQFTSQEAENVVLLLVRSNNICITLHIPIWVSEEPYAKFQLAEGLKVTPLSVSADLAEENDTKFLRVIFNLNCFELLITSRDIQISSDMEKLSSVIMTIENGKHTSLPLFDIVEVHVEAVLCKNPANTIEHRVEIICDHSNIWLSHPASYLLGAVKFDVPTAGSSQYSSNSSTGIAFKFHMRKVSILLTDGKWSYNGPQLETLVRNLLFHVNASGKHIECSVSGDLEVNYNNIEKVSWEPFIEPWQFLFTLVRKQEMGVLLNGSVSIDIVLKSITQLNVNITESLIECVSRTAEMFLDALGLMGLENSDGNKFLHLPCAELMCTRRCAAPYVLQNLSSVPLFYHVHHGPLNADECYDYDEKQGKYVQPGSAIPIYMNENAEEKLSCYRPSHSSDSLNEQRLNGFTHHYITIQLEGTSMPSNPMSMDLVGLTCFEVNFSKTYDGNTEDGRMNTVPTFVVPVVFDVSVLRYSKLIRIYSTVVLENATSTPLELRFDIPFGVSPTILDPIHPGQQLPLPLHLAEAGCVRWRPMGSSYLWSEAHNLSNLLSINSKVGNFKSFVCYPSHPSSHPFRCCLSVKNISLTSSGWLKNNITTDDAKKHYIHHLILSAPLIVSNYLPKEILLISESGGANLTVRASEVETSVYHIDPSHDLGLEICIEGFKRSDFKFPRLEAFCTMAKLSETKFSLSETLEFKPNTSNGPMYVTVEKVMDAYSGSRELIIFVPFILYNCMGFPLFIKETDGGTNQKGSVIPSYDVVSENETLSSRKDGLSLLASSYGIHAEVPRNTSVRSHTVSSRENVSSNSLSFVRNSFFSGNYHENLQRRQSKSDSAMNAEIQSTRKDLSSGTREHERVGPCMYSPSPNSAVNDVMVRVSRYFPGDVNKQSPYSVWSSPFSLLPPSGSSTILVPQLSSNSAIIVAVTSNTVAEQYTGRTNAITFQPRYVISNACSKEICYKQKGTDVMFYLGIGEHAHLHWQDITRELLVSISYYESGWQWSGSFLPDHLGDIQLKMRNDVFGTSNTIRVEVQNADISMGDEKIVGSIKGNSGTNLILLSDDDTGYMPYRIDNFSKERLRIYQQRCEMFDTVIHSYSSYPYTWDEPCYPHRLIVEVPGERVLGSFALDDVKEYRPASLPSTSEKPERTFFLSVHAEGATKVLSILDTNFHILKDMKKSSVTQNADKRIYDQKQVKPSEYKEKISIFIPYVGISLVNSYAQELLFGCVKDIQMELRQSLDRQNLSLQIAFLQIDNQLRSTPYPVMLSFDSVYWSHPVDKVNRYSSSSTPIFSLELSKWRKTDISFISFEYIKLRVADFHLEIEQGVILSLFEFFTNIYSGLQCGIIQSPDHYGRVLSKDSSFVQANENLTSNADQCPPRFFSMFSGKSKKYVSLPSVVPIGAPWQEIYLLARTQKKVYIEVLELAPIKLTLSFSSAPWMLRNRILTSKEFLIHRGLMALADVEGAQIYLKDLNIAHHMASWESVQEILVRHYNRQLLHEIYKLFGSAGVIGNPLGFARSMGLGIRDFLSVPAKSIMQSPTGLIRGMAHGTTSLLSNTVYAISDATSQFSRAARKGIVAFTYDDQAVSRMEKHHATATSDSKGVINEVLEGLTGLLQSPVRGAEKHGLPGVLSGVALGITGLVAKPAASILEVTGKTALSIRNRSRPNQLRSQCFRIRLPRLLSHELPLRPYSWEEAVGISVLMEADDGLKFKDEKLLACKALKEAGKFVVLTERIILIVFSPSLVTLGRPEFCGVPADLEWIIEWEIGLESIIHADTEEGVVHIVGSRPDSLMRQNQLSPKRSGGRTRAVRWNHYPTHLPLPQTNLELASPEDASNLLQLLLSAIENWKGGAWDCGRILHRANMK